jgi:hypothetical protein
MIQYDWGQLMRDVDAAPSILNTKPWKFDKVADDRIELRAHWDRHLRVTDPRHRELLISCGAALFNLRMAIRVSGHDLAVWLLPDEQTGGAAVCPHCGDRCGVRDLLASVEIVLGRIHPARATEQRLYEAILRRQTVREPFKRRIGMNMVAELEGVVRMEGADARLLHQGEARQLLRWAARVDKKLEDDQLYRDEVRKWTGGGVAPSDLGVFPNALGPAPKSQRRPPVRDLSVGWRALGSPVLRPPGNFERRPQLIAVETETDTPSDWLRIGQALQRLLLTATYYGVKASFLTQELEAKDREIPAYQSTQQWWPWPRPAQMVIRVGGT